MLNQLKKGGSTPADWLGNYFEPLENCQVSCLCLKRFSFNFLLKQLQVLAKELLKAFFIRSKLINYHLVVVVCLFSLLKSRVTKANLPLATNKVKNFSVKIISIH